MSDENLLRKVRELQAKYSLARDHEERKRIDKQLLQVQKKLLGKS